MVSKSWEIECEVEGSDRYSVRMRPSDSSVETNWAEVATWHVSVSGAGDALVQGIMLWLHCVISIVV